MATYTNKKKGGPKRWRGQVTMQGKVVASKWFSSAKADKNLAIAWEVEKKKELEETAKQLPTPLDSAHHPKKTLTILQWATAYLGECQRRNTLATFKEKRDGFRRFIRYLEKGKDLSPEDPVDTFDRRKARVYLAWQNDQRGPNCSNKDRKTLTTAWRWGANYLDHFPTDMPDPFLSCQRYSEIRTPRYIPPETDFWKVYDAAKEREQALLACFLNLAARKGELLKLTWDDVDFQRGTVALSTWKTRTGNVKRDEMPMNPEVRATLLWLLENREGTSGHVFTCPVEPFIGQPYKVAAHVMRRLCERAGVKAFGFHAIRHLAATILAQEGKSLFAIQHVLRHEKQTTTDRYLHSLGAFSEVSDAFSALSNRRPINVIPFRESQTLAQSPTQAQNSARVPNFGSELNIPAAPAIVVRRRQAAPAGTAPLSSTGTNGKG